MSKTQQVESADRRRDAAEEILRAVRDVRFGSVEIIIHDSKVVQVERREKIRFAQPDQPRDRQD